MNHGDATILEFPDPGPEPVAHFAVVDFGAKLAADRGLVRDYLDALVELRRDGDPDFDFVVQFACVTHPHNDHYGGLTRFMSRFADASDAARNKIRSFWDCGFRTNSTAYNRVLEDIVANRNLTFQRVSAGSEFEFGGTRVTVLAPSVDLRNRFDTFGIGKNDASIVLRIKYGNGYAILAGDAEYASWGKITEEFPRTRHITFFQDALGLAEREDTSDQLRCNVLKLAHHGSKHGTSLEYLERLDPRFVVIPAGDAAWYGQNLPAWSGMFPHDLVRHTLTVLDPGIQSYVTGQVGNVIFRYGGGWSPDSVETFLQRPGSAGFDAALLAAWS